MVYYIDNQHILICSRNNKQYDLDIFYLGQNQYYQLKVLKHIQNYHGL